MDMVTAFSIIALLSGWAGPYQSEADESSFEPFPVVYTGDNVINPPEGVHPFYKKYINADGIVLVGSENVAD